MTTKVWNTMLKGSGQTSLYQIAYTRIPILTTLSQQNSKPNDKRFVDWFLYDTASLLN